MLLLYLEKVVRMKKFGNYLKFVYSFGFFLCFFSISCKYKQVSSQDNIVSSIHNPKRLYYVDSSTLFVDFGKAFFGTIIIESSVDVPGPITIHLGEKLDSESRVDRDPPGTIRYERVVLNGIRANQPIILKLKKNDYNTQYPAIVLPDSIGVVLPFQYCEIEGIAVDISKITIRQKAYHYHFNDSASLFHSSDTILNQVWNMCKHTIKATSFTGLYIDGDRERIPYEADAFINQLSHYAVDNNYSMASNTCEYFITNATWPTEWILHTVPMFYFNYLYTGDKKLLKKYYENLKLKTLFMLDSNGLISSKSPKLSAELKQKLGFRNKDTYVRDIVDWPASQKDEPDWVLANKEGERDGYEMADYNTVVNSFYYINLCYMAEIADALGKRSDYEYFIKQSLITKNAINEKLFRPQLKRYVDGLGSEHSSLHANMFPLAFGIVPDSVAKDVIAYIKTRGMACSVYGAQYLLEGLYKYGESEYAFELLTSQSDRSWWNMIRVGSSMTMEAWDIKYKPNVDWNHAWGAAPANIITRYMWGIRPIKPGFKEVIIQPQLQQLNSSEIKVPTKKGMIYLQYIADNEKMIYLAKIPRKMNAYIDVSGLHFNKLILNGKVKEITKSIKLKKGLNELVFYKY